MLIFELLPPEISLFRFNDDSHYDISVCVQMKYIHSKCCPPAKSFLMKRVFSVLTMLIVWPTEKAKVSEST